MAPCLNRTNELREAVASSSRAVPARPKPSTGAARDSWLSAASATATTLHALSLFLSGIRAAYLDASSASSSRKAARALDFSHGLLGVDAAEWKWMSERERDEVDVQVKHLLRSTLTKIKQLEQAEHGRQSQSRSRFTGQSAASAALAAHRQSIVLFLNNLLTRIAQQQSSQQEARYQRVLDRQSSLSGVTSAAAALASTSTSTHKVAELKPVISDDPPIESLLSQEQMQAFEDEAKQLTEQAQSQLGQIKAAETSLLEISALQSELVIHLTQQAELTSKLWEDSMYTSNKVQDANKQLQKARDRNRDSRIWLLVFLIGASLTLLFLDQY